MRKLLVALGLVLVLLPVHVAFAQDTPDEQVRSYLTGLGYTVLDVGLWPDANGKPDPTTVAVEVQVSTTASVAERLQPVLYGYYALRQAYPNASVLIGMVKSGPFIYIFPSEASVFDQWTAGKLTDEAYGNYLGEKLKVYDTIKGAFVTPGAPGGEQTNKPQTNKDQTNKNFTGQSQQQPQVPACGAPPDKARFWIRNLYMGTQMDFTIGGGDWGTHDYQIPGDGQWRYIEMPPGRYTYTAHIAGAGVAHGERFDYNAGKCFYQTFSP